MITSLNNGTQYKSLEVSVKYELGGINYFTGNHNPRGYYAHLAPCSITPTKIGELRSSTLMGSKKESGFKVLIEETKRKSAKRMKELDEKIENRGNELRDLFEQNKYNDIFVLVTQN